MSNVYGAKPPLSYNKYLRVQDLINLQDLLSDPAHHDELLFITVHQAYELWFKQILHELDAGRLPEAHRPVGFRRGAGHDQFHLRREDGEIPCAESCRPGVPVLDPMDDSDVHLGPPLIRTGANLYDRGSFDGDGGGRGRGPCSCRPGSACTTMPA